MASMAELALAHVNLDFTAGELARNLGLTLPSRVGVQDLMRAADAAGLQARVQRVAAAQLQHLALPVLLLSADTGDLAAVLLLAHCDGKYVVTHDHTSVIPTNAMGPLHLLASAWAPNGKGWVLTVQPLPRC
jgi:ABC-type bacteriocin/lantibiotic exporter with double-glycine peptidase domain